MLFGDMDCSSTDATDCTSDEYGLACPWPNSKFDHLSAG
jgi:hypothetical protein